jgi:hypothetical protein
VLVPSIYHIPKREKDGGFNTKILPMSEASVRVKAFHLLTGRIECCLVYELVDQKNESESVVEGHQVFIAVRVFVRPLANSYTASIAMFSVKRGRFTGKEGDIKRLKEDILQKHLVHNTYSFECAIKDLMLRLKAVFHPGKQSIIKVTLKETTKYTDERPVLFE